MADSINLGIRITADGKGAESTINSLNKTIERVGDSSKKASQSLGGIEKAAQGLGSAATTASRALATLGVAFSARSLIQTADAYAGIVAKLKLVSGSTAEFAVSQSKLFEISQRNMTPLAETVQLYSRLATSMRDLGRSQADTLAITDLVGKTIRISGADASSAAAGILQFAQAIGSGVLRGDEFNSMMENSPRLAKALADGLNVPIGALREMAAQGELTADKVVNAILSQSDAIKREYTQMPVTVSGAFQQIQNALTQYVGQTDQASGASGKFAETLSVIAANLNDILDPLAKFTNEIVKIELGGWLTFVDLLKDAKTNLKEMAGLKDAGQVDPEIAKLMKWGSGQASIAEIAGSAPQAQEAQKQFFDGIKRGAEESALAMTKLSDKQKEVAKIVMDTAKTYKVDPAFALAIAEQESGFNQLAKSAAGARGVMQLMPETAKQLGVDFSDLTDNVKGGVIYLKQQEKAFHSLRLAAAAYNSGPGNVQKYGGIPPFAETQKYVKSVGALYEKWQKVLGSQGEAFVTAKDQADELSNAYKRLETHHDGMVQASIRAAKEAEASRATESQRIALDLKTAEDLAKQQLDSATTQQQRIAAFEQLRAAEENAAQRSKALVDEQIATEQGLLEIRRAAVSDELANADRYNLSISDRANLMRELLGIESEMRMLVEDRTQAEIAAASQKMGMEAQLRDMQKTKLDTEKAVADEQLRMNEAYANGVQQARLFATQSAEAFGSVGESIGKMVVGVMQFSEQLYQIDRDRENALKKISKGVADGSIDPSKQAEMTAKEQMKWADKSAQYQISMMGDITDASKGFFKEGSKGYKAMEMATKAFRMFEMAMALKSMVTQIMGINTVAAADTVATTQAVAMDHIEGTSKAGVAVANQATQGDPYSAPARMAVMAALMAALGFAVAGGVMGSGSSTSRREDRQKTQGTGTVFGDTAAQSESIANSLEIIKSNSSNDLTYSAAMLRSLQDLSNSILALANQVTMTVMPAIDSAIKASGMQFGKQNISLFSGFNTQLTDSGIGWFETSLSRILSGDFTAKMYADITESFEVLGSAISESTTTYVRDASKDVSSQIALIFKDMVKALQEGANSFGLSAEDVLTGLKGFKVSMEQISLKDMTMEEQTAALNAVFSKNADLMASRINKMFDLGLAPFRKAGEGMAETYFRVAEGVARANGEMEKLGLTAVNYKDILAKNKQGDVAAEITRQTLLTQTLLTDGLKAYVNELTGSAEDIIDAYKKLIQARNSMVTSGFGAANLDRTMINAAGGLDAFNAAMDAFTSNFLSNADRYTGDVRVLSEQFGQLGYTLPQSKDAFVALVSGIDTSTSAGKKLFGQMIALSESFAKVADEAEAIRNKYASILDPFKAIGDRVKQVGQDFATLLGTVTGDSQGRINTIQNNAAVARNTLTGNRDALNAILSGQSDIIKSNQDAIINWQEQLDAELAKKPKNQNKALMRRLKNWIEQASSSIAGRLAMIADINGSITDINNQIAAIDSQEGIDKAAELARLSIEKQGIINDARIAMGATLEQIFNDIVQTIQAAQQRLQSVLDLQKALASQIAQLQGSGAVFNLASADRNSAFGAIDTYIASLSNGVARNVDTEVGLLNAAQAAVMAKYNAEIAAIQEAQQAYIAAETERLNAALQLQIDAINAATEAAIEAENDRLTAAIKVQQKIDAAAIKSKQKEFDATNKLTQKQFDAEQKALQKVHDAQLKVLTDELDAANKLKDAIKSIAEYAAGLALSQNSTLSPEARMQEAQRQYQDLLARSQGGDVEAMSKLAGASDAYLQAAKAYYGSSTNYQDIFDGVQKAMTAIGGMSAPDPDSIQSRIDALREAQAEEMDKLRELQAEKLDAIREAQSDQLDQMREAQQEVLDGMRQASQDTQDAIRKAAQSQIDAAQKATQQAIADLSDPNKNLAVKAARDAAERDLAKLAELAELTRKEAERQAQEAKDQAAEQAAAAWKLANDQLNAIQAGTRLNAAQLEALNSILANAKLPTIPIPAYANGGVAQPGLALVGEQGPEIVNFSRPGMEYTAAQSQSLLSDKETKQILADIKSELKALVTTQSAANPQLVEKLSGMESRLTKMERNSRLIPS